MAKEKVTLEEVSTKVDVLSGKVINLTELVENLAGMTARGFQDQEQRHKEDMDRRFAAERAETNRQFAAAAEDRAAGVERIERIVRPTVDRVDDHETRLSAVEQRLGA